MTLAPLRHIELHGHDVGYRIAGTGDAILLIHGMAGSSRTWRAIMPDLARDHLVIAPDLLGHGESAKPLGDYSLGAFASGLRDLLVALDVERVTVVGQSLGGGVAMQLAYQHPEVVERLVLVDSGGLGREVSWMLRSLTLPGSELLMPLLFPSQARRAGDAIARALHRVGVRAPHVEEMWRAYASLTDIENRHAFLRTLRAVIDPGGQSVSAADRLYLAAAMPTLIVWGADDPIIPVEHGRAAHDAIPGSRLAIIDGAGHFPHVEAPEQLLAVLRAFLAETGPGAIAGESFRDLLLHHRSA